MPYRALLVLLVLAFLAAPAVPAAAEVPKFQFQYFDRVKASSIQPFADKALLKVIPEKRVAIYGDPDGVFIISESPVRPDKMRYTVDVTKAGLITINYYADPDKKTELPTVFKDKAHEKSYDKQVVTVELPFKLKPHDKKVVWANGRLEVSIPFSGKNELTREMRRGRGGKFLR